MPERKPPETSTVRSALATLGAVEDALDVTRSHHARLTSVADAIRASRELRPHQLDELLEHLDSRAGVEPEPSFHGMPGDGPAPVRRVVDSPQA